MSENPITEQGRIGIQLDKAEYTIAPAGNTNVTVTVRNQGLENDSFALAVGGIPATWVSTTQPVINLIPGEEKKSVLVIQAPALGETATGETPLTVRATSQLYPRQYAEAKARLAIKKETVPSRVAIELGSGQFSVAPGSSTTFSMLLKNNGQAADTLRLFIDGIPSGWVSTPSPVTNLEPGEEKEIPVNIAPPRASESRAGRHPITIRLVSQVFPEQVASQDATLTISAFAEFQSGLQPEVPLEALQNAQVVVDNTGNVSETYQINWQSEGNILAFELWQQQEDGDAVFKEVQEHTLKVEPGKQETAHFRTGLHQRPFVGGSKVYPFQVTVRDSGDEVQTHNGEVTDRGIIPVWVIPLVIVLCVLLCCLGVFIYNWLKDDTPAAYTDDSWARVQEAGVLRVATSADYPPFSYYNQDHVIDGFDPALIRDIGTVLGIQVQVSDYAFEGLGATLNLGQADAAISAISITPEREEMFDFSNIYYVGQDGILARVDSGIDRVVNLGDIAGKRVGVQQFTVYENWAQDILVGGGIISQDQLFAFAKPEHAVDDLKHARIDLVIMDLQPAIALLDPELQLVGQGLNQQRLAIAFPKGANALREKINEALLNLQNRGRVTQLAQHYLGLRPEDIVPPPTPEPTPEVTVTPIPTATKNPTPERCIDAMEFVSDLNFDDEGLTNFPLVDPGETFQKGWRIRNNGSCTWNSTYFINFVRGTQMNGQPTAIRGAVEPGQTYDMYVDLVAPTSAGEYIGYWQMHNTENQAFGQTIWVAVEVRNTNPEAPTATVTPQTTPTPTEVSPAPTATEVPPEPTATEEPGADLRDKNWILEGILTNLDDDNLSNPLPDVDVELIFQAGGNLSGNGGCNTFSGRYVTNGTAIALRDLTGTSINCTDPAGIMEQETTFLQLLDRAEEYRINDEGKLEIIREVIENEQPVKKVLLLFGE